MDLETWMREHKIIDQKIADAVGVTRPYLTKIRNGDVHPSLGTALAIWNYTKRKITLESLLPRHLRTQAMPPPEPPVEDTPRMRAARRALKSRASA